MVSIEKSLLKESGVNMSDVFDLRKKYVVGFELKNKCDLEEEHARHLGRLK